MRASRQGAGEVGFKIVERGIEHFPARYNDDIQPGRRLVVPEQLADETLGSIADDRRAELSCCGNTQPRPNRPVRRHEQGHEPPLQPHALLIGPLEIGALQHPFRTG